MSNINLCDCKENWMEIKNKNNLYLLSSKGRVYSFRYYKMVGSKKKESGYIKIGNFNYTHRLVAKYFLNNGKDYDLDTDHINTIRNHNCVCNLRICTKSQNMNNPLSIENQRKSQKGNIKKNGIKKKKSGPKINKIYKCYFCNSKLMDKGNFGQHHGNGKCLFK